jgi:hypothetical protein
MESEPFFPATDEELISTKVLRKKKKKKKRLNVADGQVVLTQEDIGAMMRLRNWCMNNVAATAFMFFVVLIVAIGSFIMIYQNKKCDDETEEATS